MSCQSYSSCVRNALSYRATFTATPVALPRDRASRYQVDTMRSANEAGAAAGRLADGMLFFPGVWIAVMAGIVVLLEALGVDTCLAQGIGIAAWPVDLALLRVVLALIARYRHHRGGHIKCPPVS